MFTWDASKIPRRLAGIAAGLLVVFQAQAQDPLVVSSPTRDANTFAYLWTPLTTAGSGGALLTDAALDQQTGQIEDDFVGTAQSGFLIRSGQINNAEAVAFRLVQNKAYRGTTFTGQASVGLDVTGEGALDLVLTAIGKNQSTGISYQAPGTGANVSPSTTTLGAPVLIAPFSSSNFNYQLVNSTSYPGATQVGTDADVMLTFAVTFEQLNNSLRTVLNNPTMTVQPTDMVRFVAFTSTQTNAINQDIYGSTGIAGATRFDAPGGGFTEFTDFRGRPVPEPSTIAAVAGLLGVGLGLRWWRARAAMGSSATAAAASGS